MDSQPTNRFNDHTDDNRRQSHFMKERHFLAPDYEPYCVIDNPTYTTVQTAPAHAYALNRAFGGKPVSHKHPVNRSQSYSGVSNKLLLKENHDKRLRHFQLYVIFVVVITILICLAFGLGFGLGLHDDTSDETTPLSSRLQYEDSNKQPDATIRVIVEDLDWDPALADIHSSSFLRSADITERSMDRYFGDSSMAEIYNYAVVSNFWYGSVGSTARIYLKSPTPNSSQEITDIYNSIRNTSGEHIIAENLKMGQNVSTLPQTDRVRFRTETLKIQAFTTSTDGMSSTSNMPSVTNTTLSGETVTSTMLSGTGSSNTTLQTTSVRSNATTASSVIISSTGSTLNGTSLTSIQTTPNGTGETTSNVNNTTTVSSGSNMTTGSPSLRSTVNGTVETNLSTAAIPSSGTSFTTSFSVTNSSEVTAVTTVSETQGTVTPSVTNSSEVTAITTVSETQGTVTPNGTQWTTPAPTADHSDPNNMTHVNETVDLAVRANFTLMSVEWNSTLADKTGNQYRILADKVADVVGQIDMNITVLEVYFFINFRDNKSVIASTILNIFAVKMNITTLIQHLNTSLHTQQQSTNRTLLELTDVDWVKDLTAVLRQTELWVWHNGKWSPVCQSTFTAPAADVVCRQLGYNHGLAFQGLSKENALQFTNLTCGSNSTQNSLSDCMFQLKDADSANCVATNLNCHNTLMHYELVGGDGATYGYVKLSLDNKDGLLCSTGQQRDEMAAYLCREINSTFYGGLNLQADILQKLTRADVWQVAANCYRPETDSVFSDCVQSNWIFLYNATISSNSVKEPDEQQPFMPDSIECPLNMWQSTTAIPNAIPESTSPETCLVKIYCHTQPVDIYQKPSSSAGYIIAANNSDPQVFCRDNFTNLEAAAACKTLGYMKGGTSLTFNPVPWFNSRLWKYTNYDYKCLENETIYGCNKTEIDVTQRLCSGPAVVKCVEDAATEKDWDMKLDSDNKTVLLYYKGQWGTICDAGTKYPWTTKEATVVCKQLHYTHGVPVSVQVIPAMPLPHVITNVTCSDTQATLADCTYSEVKDDSCNSSYAATVFCYNSTNVASLDLVTGSEFNSGLVKVTREDKEGYLCTWSLPSKAVAVMCRSFGFVSGEQDTYTNFTDPHLQYIWQTDFNGQCTVNDVLAETCRSAAWVLHTANLSLADTKCVCHDSYVSLYCYGKVKLSFERRKNYGSLLIYDKGDYNSICQEDVNQQTATAACREITRLNTSDAVILYPGTFVSSGATAKTAAFNCSKDATSVSDCVTFSNVLHLQCKQTSLLCYEGTETPGPIPENATEWRIEEAVVQVKAYGIWGTICSDGWTNTEATVLCKTTNSKYTLGIAKTDNRPPTVPMWLSNVTCDSNTTNINMCSRMTFLESVDYCTFGDIAQTYCFTGENDVPRFTLGDVEETTYYVKGHLTVTRNNQTGYLCSQDKNSIESNADALCRIMRYTGGQVSQITISSFNVSFTWNGIFDCNWYTPDCFLNGNFTQRTDLNHTVSITTYKPCGDLQVSDILCFKSKVHLQDPESPEGFLLILGQNGWQALCSENFTLESAKRFCTDAGYISGNYTAGSASDAQLTAGFKEVNCINVARFEDCTFSEIPSEASDRCNDIVYIYCINSTNITIGDP